MSQIEVIVDVAKVDQLAEAICIARRQAGRKRKRKTRLYLDQDRTFWQVESLVILPDDYRTCHEIAEAALRPLVH